MGCSKCNEDISKPSETAKCVECKAEFHPGCCRIRTVAKLKGLIASGAMWQCEDCNKDTTSVGSKSDSEDPSMLSLLKNIQKQISEDNTMFKTSFSSLEQSISKVQDSLAAVITRLSVVEEENYILKEECKVLKNENSMLVKRVRDAEWRIIEQEQHSRMENLEIRGVPQTGGEDVYAILEAISGALGIPFERQDISIAHRLPGPRDRRFHPAIVVQFARRSTRADWLVAAKTKRIQTTDLYTSLTPGPVFINEHLTQHNKALLHHCKAGVRAKSLAYAWSKDGKVFVRVTQESRAIRVFRSIQELEGLDHHSQMQSTPHNDTK